jgi:hypothetical protein
LKVYKSDDSEVKMVCCDQCDRWLHIGCVGITEAAYDAMEEDEEQQPYTCPICKGEKEDRANA